MDQQVTELLYIPSTVEKKRAIACLLFMGILMSLVSQKTFSVYEYYYLGMSIGLWSVRFFVVLITLIGLLVPLFLILSLPLLIFWFGCIGFAMTEARQGVYNNTSTIFRLFVGVGSWLLSLFEVQSNENPKT